MTVEYGSIDRALLGLEGELHPLAGFSAPM